MDNCFFGHNWITISAVKKSIVCLHSILDWCSSQKDTLKVAISITVTCEIGLRWDSPRVKLCYTILWLELFQLKTITEEKTVIVRLGKSQACSYNYRVCLDTIKGRQ